MRVPTPSAQSFLSKVINRVHTAGDVKLTAAIKASIPVGMGALPTCNHIVEAHRAALSNSKRLPLGRVESGTNTSTSSAPIFSMHMSGQSRSFSSSSGGNKNGASNNKKRFLCLVQ